MEEVIVFSVYELTLHLRQVIETSIEPLYISGEISNFTHHSSGHMYFNLKDDNATIRCAFFRNSNFSLDFKPEDGQQVICFGKVTVFEKAGQYNFNVNTMQLAGQGSLSKQFEMLKQKLKVEGLFDQEYKKPIPKFPESIGIISSPTGAAIQDIMNILTRRYPVQVFLYPSLVQGADAPEQLIEGIRYFNEVRAVDLIILTRGGGSQEDLWAFNDENLARAIFKSRTPIISAVGHEIDFSISDFVADLRAPTPSAAAEISVPDKKELLSYIDSIHKRLQINVSKNIGLHSSNLKLVYGKMSYYEPQNTINRLEHRIDICSIKLLSVKREIDIIGNALNNYDSRLSNAYKYVILSRYEREFRKITLCADKIKNIMNTTIKDKNGTLEQQRIILNASSPSVIMKKGFVYIIKDSKLVKSVTQLRANDIIDVQFTDGLTRTQVQEVSRNNIDEK